MAKCIFAGSFDPVTVAHKYVVDCSAKTFGKVVVAVGNNGEKRPMLSVEERVNLLKKVFENRSDVEVVSFDGLLVDYMKNNGIEVNIRGVRNEADFEYERSMQYYNKKMYPQIQTYFLPTPPEMNYISSSAVRAVINLNGDYQELVPKECLELLKSYIKK